MSTVKGPCLVCIQRHLFWSELCKSVPGVCLHSCQNAALPFVSTLERVDSAGAGRRYGGSRCSAATSPNFCSLSYYISYVGAVFDGLEMTCGRGQVK